MKIGDKVVCVDASPSRCQCCLGTKLSLIKGNVYVVEMIHIDGGLALFGIKPLQHIIQKFYHKDRFRLLDELKKEAVTRQNQSQPLTAGLPVDRHYVPCVR